MVSVVIPTYNRGHLVGEAVASVLSQERASYEIIVVDDGSTDNTADILASLGPSVRLERQAHAGVSAARNRGIRASSREWIAFLDSDDLWLPRKLEKQLDFLAASQGLRTCQTEEIWVRDGKRVNPRKYHEKPSGWCFPRLLERCLISPSAVMIHRSVFDEVGLFDESLPACEDYDLWLRIGCRYPIGLLPEPLIVKRGGHADQLSASVPCLDRYRIRALVGVLQSSRLGPEDRRAVAETLEKKVRIYAQGCRKRGRDNDAEAVLSLLELACPTDFDH